MANTKAAKKALRSSLNKRFVNKNRRSRVRTFIKNVDKEIKDNNINDAIKHFKILEKEIMRGVTKKVVKFNTAKRKLKRLHAMIKKQLIEVNNGDVSTSDISKSEDN